MATETVWHCDGPDCERHVQAVSTPGYIGGGFLEVRETVGHTEGRWHFCGWDCAMKFAATQEPEIIIPLEGE